ncbi:sucrose nonfermenting 4-like protein-like [Dorcoceras hygrometricum]|uniref:Sucrose nonfermenting 4-like protein-like n=1 Tax=Dorcoceras hygrometricum TaxID=472368 RepID=A0A2Z7AIP2_9LAMI|nr:sucrose nonfermenting 4-like protein-like [Dorcoceras hygrometricum]
MVQTPFTWRYGGREVFLSGSFNGWSERIQMIPMEGSSIGFQIILDLPLGCYQYKFLVDGTWQVDQQQICDVDEYGTVNNIVLVSGTEFVSPDFKVEAFQPSTSGANDRAMLFVVFILDIEVDVEQAFHVMYDKLHSNPAIFASDDLGRQTVSSWKGWKFQHHRDVLRTLVPGERMPLIHAGPDESLADVASRILQNNISAIPVVYSVNGLCPRLLHIACLSGVLKHVCRHLKHHLGYLTLLQQPVGFLPLGTWAKEFRRTSARPLLTMRLSDSLNAALTMLLEAQISSIPIVDGGGNLVDMYSRSDIISLAKDNMYTQIQLYNMTISQAIEIAVDVRRDRLQTCTRFDSLYRVMELLSEPDTRRVIIVEARSRRVEGVITLRDVFDFLSTKGA